LCVFITAGPIIKLCAGGELFFYCKKRLKDQTFFISKKRPTDK